MLQTRNLIIGFLRPRFYSLNAASKEIKPTEKPQEKLIKLAIIGLPNVGKSTFINSIVEKRVIYANNIKKNNEIT
jgi:ribosome biogenesis GTPase A